MSFYRYFKQNAEVVVNFNEWMMKKKKKDWIIPLFEAYNFSVFKTFVDFGGNISSLTTVILKDNPKRQAILLDKEDVVGANQVLEVGGVVDRCPIVGGNFFDSLPLNLDIYLISRVLLNTK